MASLIQMETEIIFSRLIAKGGDTLEIKTGYAYINGKFADDSTILKFTYTFSADYYQKIADLLNINLGKHNPKF